MAPSLSPRGVVTGGRATDVRSIQREIDKLWQGAVASATAAGASATRAHVLNLIVYAPTLERVEQARAAIAGMAKRRPSRTVIVSPARGRDAPPIDATVALYCPMPTADRRQVCYEEIHVAASADGQERLVGTLPPLLVPDLPIFLWWLAEARFERALFNDLAGLAVRVIVDSAEFADPFATLARLRTFSVREEGGTRVGDLNWGRITPWREQIAQFFDPPDTRQYLARIDEVTIEARAKAASAQSLLLAGWLTGRLRWGVAPHDAATRATRVMSDESGVRSLRLRRHAGAVAISFEPSSRRRGEPGDVMAVTLGANADGASFSIQPGDESGLVVARVQRPGAPAISRRARMRSPLIATILAEELNIFGHDRIYEEALGTIQRCERAQ